MRRNQRRTRARSSRKRTTYAAVIVVGIVIVLAISVLFLTERPGLTTTSTTKPNGSTDQTGRKPIILYVNQGNGVVDETNFDSMLSFAIAHGFNTVFFQVYRSGNLLFSQAELSSFIQSAHSRSTKIFLALYFTNSSQQIPPSIYSLGEDGINLDMSTLLPSEQSGLFDTLQKNYPGGEIAITSTDFSTNLRPNLLILETYGSQYDTPAYVHMGIVASVGVFATTSESDYQQQFQYALDHSDGVMVFDYAALSKSGY